MCRQQPQCWGKLDFDLFAHRHKASPSVTMNFGYDQCVVSKSLYVALMASRPRERLQRPRLRMAEARAS